MGAGDFNISVRLDAGVTGAQDVKALTLNIKDLFAEAGSKGADKLADSLSSIRDEAKSLASVVASMGKDILTALNPPEDPKAAEAMRKTREEAAKAAAAAQALAKDFADTFKGDVTVGLKKGLADSDATVKKITADLRAMYAAQANGNTSPALKDAITLTERKLKDATAEMQKFQNQLGQPSPTPAGGGGAAGLGIGSLVGGLTVANLLSQAITASFRAIKDSITDIVAEGMKMNEFLEISQFGIATSVQAQYNLKDAQGKVLEGQDAYNAALEISAEQMKQIRIAGLETAATSQELVKNFQTAVGVGASQNITDLNKLRQLTIDVTNAATALGVSQSEVPTAIRAVITGREVEENQLARILVGTGEQVRQWQQSGKLLDELNKRLGPFSAGAKQAAGSWAVVKSNIEEAFQVFSGEVTEGLFTQLRDAAGQVLSGVFDTKNLGISEAFSNITGVVKDMFSGVGAVIVDMLKGAIDLAQQFNKWIGDNKTYIDEWEQGLKEIWVSVKSILGTFVDLVKAVFNVRKESGELDFTFTSISIVMKVIAYSVAAIADGMRTVGGAVIWLAGLLVDLILHPVKLWLNTMGDALNAVKKGWGDNLLAVGKAIDDMGSKIRATGAGLFDAYANGTNAIAKVTAAFNASGKAAEEAGKKTKKAGATVDGAKNPQKKQPGLSAAQAVAKAEADALIATEKDRLAREQRELDYALSQQLVSIKDYYAKRQAEQLNFVKLEEQAKQKEMAALRAATPKTIDEQQTKKAQEIKLQNEINLLKAKENDIITENAQKQEAANHALTNKVTEIRAQLEQQTGQQTFDTMAAQIDEKFRLIRQQFVTEFGADSEQVNLVDRLVDVEKSKANFNIIQTQYNTTLDAMKLKEQEINTAQEQGSIGPMEAVRQLNALHTETAQNLSTLLPQMEAYARSIGDETMLNNVQRLKMELKGLGESQNELGKAIDTGLTNNLTSFFNSLTDSSKSASDAIKDFGRSVLNTFLQLINQQLAKQLMSSLFGGGSGGGGSAGFWSGLVSSFAAKADGGYISGPGTSTSDSIPAMLSDGEYVIKSSAVKRLGVGFLNLLNGVPSATGRHHFADGGPVTSTIGPAPSMKAENKIINVFDPSLVEGMLGTPRGVTAVLNVIGNNPEYIRAMLS